MAVPAQTNPRPDLIRRYGEATVVRCDATLMVHAYIADDAEPIVKVIGERTARAIEIDGRAANNDVGVDAAVAAEYVDLRRALRRRWWRSTEGEQSSKQERNKLQ